MHIQEVQTQLIDDLLPVVKKHVQSFLAGQSVFDVASLTSIQEVAQAGAMAMSQCIFAVWKEQLVRAAEALGSTCPGCGKPRRHRWRSKEPMKLSVLGFEVELPKLYLECNRCDAPGISIIRALTGLQSGDASEQQKLACAYCAADHSYGSASRDMETHYGQPIERTKVRRMALEIEQSAMAFAEQSRAEALSAIGQEGAVEGPAILMLEGDGGKVRTGTLTECEPGDTGFGKTTDNWGIPRRKRPTNFRELITFDVREPGEVEASALDVMVPVQSEKGERTRRMLALAARKGMGDNTQVIGLGDMGSGLASAFDEAFDVNPASFWEADWKHTRDYVHAAGKILVDLDATQWENDIRQAIWARDHACRDALIDEARQHRISELTDDMEKCPLEALATYLGNNWEHMRFAELYDKGLPIVSARAEAQVRDRTKGRFSGPGVWRVENLEPKATLRSIIAEGRWQAFRDYHLDMTRSVFATQLLERLEQAVCEGRLQTEHASKLLGRPATRPSAPAEALPLQPESEELAAAA
jgi:hypothetical protein